MKLAIVRQRYNPFGGAERLVERALSALATGGAQVTLITRSWDGSSESGFEKVICNPTLRWPFNGRTSRDRAFSRCVLETITRRDFDLVQSHERIPGCSIFRAGDGVHAAWLEHRSAHVSPIKRYAQRVSPYHHYLLSVESTMFAHPALRAVICNSQMVASEIERYYGVERKKLHVIYNGVDTDDFHPRLAELHRAAIRHHLGIRPDVPLLLYVGSGYERKGVPQLLRAFASLRRDDVHLIIIGADRRLVATKRTAAHLGLSEHVHFLGPVQDVRPFYGAADGFVLPTIYDPCPNAALEAMACGLPMVTSEGCGAKEWINEGRNGWVVRLSDDQSLANALDNLCTVAGDASMRACARASVEHFDLRNMSKRLLELYESILQTKNQPEVFR